MPAAQSLPLMVLFLNFSTPLVRTSHNLMWMIFMVTDLVLYKLTVAQTFDFLNLTTTTTRLATHIPGLLGISHIEAYEHVVTALEKDGIMVILDNHRQQQFLWRPVL
jgi:hypothetical protein